jgi:lipopolysaccharide export system protein LptC
MSKQGELSRTKLQHWARPGGAHDKWIKILNIALPVSVGALVAFLVATPVVQKGSELSFLLDQKQVEVAKERMRTNNPVYKGTDSKGRDFEIKAATAFQRTAEDPTLEMEGIEAGILMGKGPASLAATKASYNLDDEKLMIPGQFSFNQTNGYTLAANNVHFDMNTQVLDIMGTGKATDANGRSLEASNVRVDLKAETMLGRGPVSGAVPQTRFTAGGMEANMKTGMVVLTGGPRVTGTMEGGSYSADRVTANTQSGQIVLDGQSRVSGTINSGSFSAGRVTANSKSGVVVLEGRPRLRIQP